MKRFFIFAAMLLTLTANAVTLDEDPPMIKPEAEQIILVSKGMHEIERTIAFCGYTLSADDISISCFGTGSDTQLYLTDSRGVILDYAEIDPDITSVITFDTPENPGIYHIMLDSRLYYGECIIMIE